MILKTNRGDGHWISLLLIISIFFVDAVFRVRSYDDKSLDVQVVLKVLVYLMVFIAGLLLRKSNGSNFQYSYNKCLLALILIFAFSACWSPNSAYTLVASFSLLAFFIFITSYASSFGTTLLLKNISIALLAFMIVSFIFYIFIPTVGRISYWEFDVYVEGGRMSGIAGSANNLGRISCLGIMLSTYLLMKSPSKLYKALFFLSVISLLLSMNRSSMLMAMIGVCIITYSRRYEQIYALLISLGVIGLCLLLVFLDDFLFLISRSGNIEEILTFTGRTHIWSVVVDLFYNNPILGYGYGSSMFILPKFESVIGFTASHAHNMVLQILLYMGVVGFGLLLISFLVFFVSKPRKTKFQISLIVYVLYNGLLESGAFNGLVNITTITLFVAYNARSEREYV
jgi:O-antigen ligase